MEWFLAPGRRYRQRFLVRRSGKKAGAWWTQRCISKDGCLQNLLTACRTARLVRLCALTRILMWRAFCSTAANRWAAHPTVAMALPDLTCRVLSRRRRWDCRAYPFRKRFSWLRLAAQSQSTAYTDWFALGLPSHVVGSIPTVGPKNSANLPWIIGDLPR